MASISSEEDIKCDTHSLERLHRNELCDENRETKPKIGQSVRPHYYRNNKGPLYRALDQKVVSWVRTNNNKNQPYNGPMLQKIARGFAKELGITDFKGSTTWVERFKGRHSEVVFEAKKELRKVSNLTMEKKVELINEVDKGFKSKRELAEDYGIAPSTLCGIMVNRTKIMEAFHSQAYNPERKKFRKSSFQDVELELLKWISQWRKRDVPFNGPKLAEKAKEIAKRKGITDFIGSNAWIDRFKSRHNIRCTPPNEMNDSNKLERKITTLTLEKKVELLEEVDKGIRSKKQIAESFGIAPSTLTGIVVNRERIMEAFYSRGFGPERKKFRRSTFETVETDLLEWMENCKQKNEVVKTSDLLDKAKDIAKEKGIDNFGGTHSWIERFKMRNLRAFIDTQEEGGRSTPKANGHDSNQSDIVTSNDSAPSTPEVSASDFSNISQVPRTQAYDSVEHTPEFQNIFKKHKCRDQYRKYTPEQLMEACKYSLETKASYREVSEKFGVPQSTLRDKLHAVEKLNADAGFPPLKKPRVDLPETSSQEAPTITVVSPQPPEINTDEKTNDQRSNYRQYSKDSLTTAAHYVAKFNTPIMKAARMFGVPASTLKDHVKNKITFDITEPTNQGSIPSLINERDEKKLIEYIKMMEKCGFILTMKEIIEFGSELASASQEIEGSITLSDSWYHDFVKRWPPIGLVNREGRSPVPHDIKRYFLELNKVFNKHKFFERPELVYVIDEVDITLQYNPLKLVPGKKLHRKNSRTSQPLLTSVVGCCNALGTSLPPYYVLQSDEILTEVISQSPPGTQASFANSGSKDTTVLKDYFQNHFIRFAQSGRNTQNRFVLVFYDSRKTNLNVSDIEWAKRWHILLFPLPHPIKRETDFENEMIDGIFQNYSNDVETERSQFVKEKGFMAVAMPDICGILGKAYRKSLSYSHIVSCFENWGIYPLHPQNYVDKLDISFQLKLQDLRALPNYDTNLWLLSDFSCTQAVNNAIESSFNESTSFSNNRQNISSSQLSRQNSGSDASYGKYNQEFNASYQGMLNHLIGQAVQNHQEPQIVNGVAIKTEPIQEPGYGALHPSSSNGCVLETPTERLNNQVVPQMRIIQTFSESLDTNPLNGQENQSVNETVSCETIGQIKNKYESSSSSRRKGKSHRVIVNELDPEIEKEENESLVESQSIISKAKPDSSRKHGKLGSLLDEKVRELHEQAKASCENEDNDEPLMQVGEFQIVINKGD